MKREFSLSRRNMLRQSAFGAATVMLVSLLPTGRLQGADEAKLSEDDPAAKSLKYVHDATKSERPDDSQFCHNCQYFKGEGETGWGPCDIFPGKSVNAEGWCSTWAEKA
jgi:hypothetical protein